VVPILPTLYDLLIDHKAESGYGAHDPVFATRNRRRNTVDNGRRTIVDALADRANACWQPAISRRGVMATNWQPANKNASQPGPWSELEGTDTPSCRTFSEAAEGTRTLDLLHGKQTL
jgi:hypothetical protein